MHDIFTQEKYYLADGKALNLHELGLALYHISRKTDVSKAYTLKFVDDVLLRASELLLEEPDESQDQYEDKVPQEQTHDGVGQVTSDFLKKHKLKGQWCEYHGAEHLSTPILSCPANPDKQCYCCEAGRQRCMKQKAGLNQFEQFGENYLSSKHADWDNED